MNIKGKVKDNVKARMNLKEYCNWSKLELMKVGNGRIYKPKAKFHLPLSKSTQYGIA